MSFLDTYRKIPKILYRTTEHLCLLTLISFSPQLRGFPISGGDLCAGGLIFGVLQYVKIKSIIDFFS